ncbi:Uncharacterised protein [Actinomyces bovis]|uniref:Uncharacterized protein n=1 Tax=Actinomyces bovis TaxID=1658 RepID=A0ABY1VN95_9ACTO|nr:Uncharacterised protein [Actinomyces bovis]VEG55330.1 Uncharacterised protein [Actinomyces israelii]
MAVNPWLPPPAPEPGVVQTVPVRPKWAPGAEVRVEDGLPVARVPGGGLWVLGAHGGAGATTVAGLMGANDALGAWPLPTGASNQVVVVARTSAYGAWRAQLAALQWASGALPGIDLVGVVWVSAAPGRIPKDLRQQISLVCGAFPRSAALPWVRPWRVEHPISTLPPKRVQADLKQFLAEI